MRKSEIEGGPGLPRPKHAAYYLAVWLLQMGDCPSKNEKLIEGKIH